MMLSSYLANVELFFTSPSKDRIAPNSLDSIFTSRGASITNWSSGPEYFFDAPQDSFTGTAGDDVIVGTIYADTIDGLAGNDILEGNAGNDVINGGDGNDIITDSRGNLTADGGAGDDIINITRVRDFSGEYENLTLLGGSGNDRIIADSFTYGVWNFNLGTGNDELVIGQSSADDVTIRTGSGSDIVRYLGTGQAQYSLATGYGVNTFKDFAAGSTGDSFDISERLGDTLFNWDGFSNPFGSGHMRLLQSGAHVLLQIDRDAGASATYGWQTAFVLENTTVTSFLANNFNGWARTGTAPTASSFTGTALADTYIGTNGNDTVNGLDGDDALNGRAGNDTMSGGLGVDTLHGDVGNDILNGDDGNDQLFGDRGNDILNGGLGNDTLNGGLGDDTVDGGAGNDLVIDNQGGSDTLSGGDGADRIQVSRSNYNFDINARPVETVSVLGGAGNDFVEYDNRNKGTASFNLGDGDDVLSIVTVQQGATITMGTGSDRLILSNYYSTVDFTTNIVVTDFQAGNSGDVIDINNVILLRFNDVWDGVTNPITAGLIRIDQVGADTIIRLDYDGNDPADVEIIDLVRLQNVNKTQLTAYNLGGIPLNGTPVPASTVNGTTDIDLLFGTLGNNTINALAGDDIVNGGAGSDIIYGGDGNDRIISRESLTARGDTLYGDNGDDTIIVQSNGITSYTDRIFGGAGNDWVSFAGSVQGQGSMTAVINLGSGNDFLDLRGITREGKATVTTGSGQDIVKLGTDYYASGSYDGTLIITDFTPGDGGDRLDFTEIAAPLAEFDPPGFNPFAGQGWARLFQNGNNVELQFSRLGDGNNFFTIAVFQNTNVAAFTDFNLGYDLDAPPPPGVNLTGTASQDLLVGTQGDDILSGLGGTDELRGNNGADLLDGGTGDDILSGGGGNDVLIGGIGRDEISGGAGDDQIDAGDGDDFIAGGPGVDTINAGAGNDWIQLDDTDDQIDGGDGYDIVEFTTAMRNSTGGIQINFETFTTTNSFTLGGRLSTNIEDVQFVDGSRGNDNIFYGSTFTFNIALNGYEGDDVLTSGESDDVLDGGDGNDILTSLGGFDQLNGGNGNDRLLGGDDDDSLVGGAGNDRLEGGNGNDEIFSGTGTDTIIAGAGDDIVYLNASAGDSVNGGTGIDRIIISPEGGESGALDIDFSAFWTGGSILVGGAAFSFTAFESYELSLGNGNNRVIIGDGTTTAFNLQALSGDDFLTGGGGNDRIEGYYGMDRINGGAGDDVIIGDRDAFSDGQDDVLFGGTGNDSITGNGGNDQIFGQNGNDLLNGDNGDDQIDGGAGNDQIGGGDGNDILNGGAGTDNIFAGAGDDIILFGAGFNDDTISGGIGFDTLRATANGAQIRLFSDITGASIELLSDGGFSDVGMVGTDAGETFDLNSGFGGGFQIEGSVYFGGGGGNDTLLGNASANNLRGGTGNDRLEGREGDDLLSGENGDDVLIGGDGVDTLSGGLNNDNLSGGSGNDTLMGDDGNDTLSGGAGNDVVNGGAGTDLASYADAVSAVQIFLTRQGVSQNTLGGGVDTLIGIEGVIGSAFADTLQGSSGNDRIEGGDGNDRVVAGLGNDVIFGDGGNDVIDGGAGNDFMAGGIGDDRYTIRETGDLIVEHAFEGNDSVRSQIDYTLADNVENLTLVAGARVGTGNVLDNAIFGSAGNDTLTGLDGNDILRGNSGRDTIIGGNGADLIDGGAGKDTLTGGGDRDTFFFRDGDLANSRTFADIITDFDQTQAERINFNLIDANINLGGNQSFEWIASAAFSGTAGELRFEVVAGNTVVEGDTNGDGAADIVLIVNGLPTLTASDFVGVNDNQPNTPAFAGAEFPVLQSAIGNDGGFFL